MQSSTEGCKWNADVNELRIKQIAVGGLQPNKPEARVHSKADPADGRGQSARSPWTARHALAQASQFSGVTHG
jgi:hypothetical protein